jgi:hypothetical protein
VTIAEELLVREVLDGADVIDILNGRPLRAAVNPPKPTPTTPNNDGGTVIAPHPNPLPGLLGGESPQPA